MNTLTSLLLLERYIKPLEMMHHPKEFKLLYPNPDIPMYLTKIPIDITLRQIKTTLVFDAYS
jgi:hypothetical protein